MRSTQPIRDGAKATGAVLAAGAAAIAVLIVLAVMWIFGWGFMSQTTAPWRGETEKRELIEADGSYRIAAYDHFFDLCSAIQGSEAQIEQLQVELDGNPTPEREQQLRSFLTAAKANRGQKVADYNAEAAKDYTSGQFRDSDLPYRINPNAEETTCAA